MSAEIDIRRSALGSLKVLCFWTLSVLVDSVFLTLWLLSEYGITVLIHYLPLEAESTYQLKVFQFIFAFSTLIPVIAITTDDIIYIIFESLTSIRKTIKRAKKDE